MRHMIISTEALRQFERSENAKSLEQEQMLGRQRGVACKDVGATARSHLISKQTRGVAAPIWAGGHIWHEEAIHPQHGVWVTRITCMHCGTAGYLHPGHTLHDVTPPTNKFLREHIRCRRIMRGRARQAEGKEHLKRVLGGPNPWSQ